PFATRREGAEYLARVRGELLAGNVAAVVPTTTTLEDYARTYLRDAAATLRPRTLDLYRRLLHRWVLPAVGTGAERVQLGPLPLSGLTPPPPSSLPSAAGPRRAVLLEPGPEALASP